MRALLPGSLTFLQVSGFAGADREADAGNLVWCRLGAAWLTLRSEKRRSGCGATGKAPFSTSDCP
ncbi:hypothetical protein, partial [Mesorhizobium sp. M7A.F.Ca.CA.002.04.1.1]|uniref:hypothetical protein n=1 Tax=Mesorhizobium sp. M7A.F.Ca.CA.002.04.1.1 TaxID=2496681 RepID=UPI0019D45995